MKGKRPRLVFLLKRTDDTHLSHSGAREELIANDNIDVKYPHMK